MIYDEKSGHYIIENKKELKHYDIISMHKLTKELFRLQLLNQIFNPQMNIIYTVICPSNFLSRKIRKQHKIKS